MTDYAFPPSFRATDADDNPLSGGTMRFFAAGTSTPKAVYSDTGRSVSLGTQVNINSAGVPVSGSNVPILIYYGTGSYKYELYDSNGVLVPGMGFDNIAGYVEPEEAASTALPEIPVDSKTTTYTVVAGDKSNLINCNPTGGSFPVFLPSAVTVGDGFLVGFKHNGTANSVTLVATNSQNIRFQGNRTAFSLVGQGEVIWLLADGSDWNCVGYAPPFRKATDPYFIVLDQLTAPPASPDAGARYLVNGTATGAWSTLSFAEHDIAEADGNGSWIRHTPEEGWMAFDADEKISLVYKDGAWENFQIDPGTSTLKTLIVHDQKSSGTVGGTAATAAWTTSVLNTSAVNTITDASLASNKITLPAGRYRVKASKVFVQTEASRLRFKTADDDSIVLYGNVVQAGFLDGTVTNNARSGATATLDGEFEVASSTDFILQYYVVNSVDTNDLGFPSSISGFAEVYATVVIEDLAAQQGPKGDQGDPGEEGLDAAYAYQFNTATSGDPGTGKIRTNHATPASVTQIAVHQTDANGSVLTNVIASWDDSTSTTSKARIRWHKEGDPQNFFEFLITGTGTDAGDYWTFPVSYVSHGGTISNTNDIAVLVIQTGDIGSPGTTVPDISGLTEKTSPSLTDDYSIIYDDAASAHKKYLPFSRDAGLTQFDSALWTGARAHRIGVDLTATGASYPGDNEWAQAILVNTPTATNSIAHTYKVASISVAATSDPSESDGSILRMSVGKDMRGYILAGNTQGVAFGGFSGLFVQDTADGFGFAHEAEVNNFGTAQPLVNTMTSKGVFHAVAGGDTAVTTGLKFSSGEFYVNQFYYGIHGFAADFLTAFIHLDGAHAVLPTGAGGFGTDDPQRMIHSWVSDAVTNAISGALRLTHESSGTVAASFGLSMEWELESAGGTKRIASSENVFWDVATDAAEYASYQLNLMSNGTLINAMTISSLGILNITGYYSVDGTQVVSNQGAAVADASGGATVDAEARTAINTLLSRLRTHGLIAT